MPPALPYYRYYAAEISYFSGKVRPALRYKGLHFQELLPDIPNVILPRTGLAFIPILVTPEDETLQDTSDILDELERRHPTPPLYPTSPVHKVVCYLWELYADEFALLPGMHYRWSFPEGDAHARASFAAVVGDASVSSPFADRMHGSLPFLGVQPHTIPAIEAHTHELLDLLCAHFEHHPFLLGSRMSLADCSLMGPFYGHLYLDVAPGALLRERAIPVCHWIERMNRPDPEAEGEWLENDTLAPTLRHLLELTGRDAARFLVDGIRAIESWADDRPADMDEPPRAVGGYQTTLRGVEFTRMMSVYSLWIFQRPLDAYRALSADGRKAVDAALAGTGWEEVLAYQPRHRLGKRNFKLVFED